MVIKLRIILRDGEGNRRDCGCWREFAPGSAISAVLSVCADFIERIDPLSKCYIERWYIELPTGITRPGSTPSNALVGALLIFGDPAGAYRDTMVIPGFKPDYFDAVGEYAGLRVLESIPTLNSLPGNAALGGIVRDDGSISPPASAWIVGGKVAL